MKKYNVLKKIGTKFVVGDIIETDDIQILTGSITTCSIQFLLDEGYIEEIKEKVKPKFRIGEEIRYNKKGFSTHFGTITGIETDNENIYYVTSFSLGFHSYKFIDEEYIFEPTNEELGTYF